MSIVTVASLAAQKNPPASDPQDICEQTRNFPQFCVPSIDCYPFFRLGNSQIPKDYSPANRRRRRVSTYKRADLVFSNIERLKWIARHVGPFQLIFAGKAHPHDGPGKDMIRRFFGARTALEETVRVAYVENCNWEWAKHLTSGVDLWLNTPQRPQGASGTSGMKAAINGVPSLSILDGWWIEGRLEGITGWAIGHGSELAEDPAAEANSLYDKLEMVILPMFYGSRNAYGEVMRSAIAVNGSFFNTRRMVIQYVSNAYFPELTVEEAVSNRSFQLAGVAGDGQTR